MPSWRPPEQGEDGSQIFLIGDDLLKTKPVEGEDQSSQNRQRVRNRRVRRNCKSFKTFVSKPELNEKDSDQDEKHEEDGRRRLTKASSNAKPSQGK